MLRTIIEGNDAATVAGASAKNRNGPILGRSIYEVRGWNRNLRAGNAPGFVNSDCERWPENEGLGTVRKLDRINDLFLVT
jgi:hypothetical protein